MRKVHWWVVGIALLSCGVVAGARAVDPEDGYEERTLGGAVAAEPAATAEAAEYWIGVGYRAVSPALRAQLNLPGKEGLLVEVVVTDSPAAKAGIVPHDILLRAGGKPVVERRDLVRAIEASKGGKLKIELLRQGQPKTVEVTPGKRPEAARRVGAPPGSADWDTIEKWLQGMSPENETGRSPLRFHFIHPGMIVPPGVAVSPPLPADMSVVISKEGDQPAKIVVRRGAESWEVTEKDLNKLPAEIRTHVEEMLGRGAMGFVGASLPPLEWGPESGTPKRPAPAANSLAPSPPRADWFERMEKRLDEMNGRLDRLFQEVERGREHPAPHEAPPKPAQP
jgi:membrane-associated protease RseP (regulator of RpoE activity)